MTAEFKIMILTAAALGVAIGIFMAWLDTVRGEREFISYVCEPQDGPHGPAPGEVADLMDEARRITGESAGDA
jgi:hypothetical protein